MALTPTELQQLKTELETDPTGAIDAGGHAVPVTLTSDHAAINLILIDRDDALGAGPVDHEFVASALICAAAMPSEFQALTGAEEAWLTWITSKEDVKTVVPAIKEALTSSSGEGVWRAMDGATMDAIRALIEFQGARTEVLFGEGTFSTPSEIADALRLP